MSDTPPYYPPLTSAQMTPFRAIEVQLQANIGYLNDERCPYPHDVKLMLRRLANVDGGGTVAADARLQQAQDLVDPSSGALDLEIADLYITVKNDSASYTGSDMKDKMSFMKTAQDLLSKIVDLQSKRMNIRQMARMQKAVIETMEEFLDNAQRSKFIQKLKDLIDVG